MVAACCSTDVSTTLSVGGGLKVVKVRFIGFNFNYVSTTLSVGGGLKDLDLINLASDRVSTTLSVGGGLKVRGDVAAQAPSGKFQQPSQWVVG